jgi:hypothetical protein
VNLAWATSTLICSCCFAWTSQHKSLQVTHGNWFFFFFFKEKENTDQAARFL